MKTILIIGLGNPGQKYQWTRHNAGKDFLHWKCTYDNAICHKENNFSYFVNQEADTYYVMPEVDMNNNGIVLNSGLLNKIIRTNNQIEIIILHDDLSMPFGSAKLRKNVDRGPRGHNGNRSIIEHLKKILGSKYTQPYYLSIGINRPSDGDVATWVLQKFNISEKKIIENLFFEINNLLARK